MSNVLNALKALVVSGGAVVDSAVPVATGNRTVLAVLASYALQYAPALVSLIPPPYGAAVATLLPLLGKVASVAVAAFAAAHVARSLAPAPAK